MSQTELAIPRTGAPSGQRLVLNIGAMPVALHTGDAEFAAMIEQRYGEFVEREGPAQAEIEVQIVAASGGDPDQDMQVSRKGSIWRIERGDLSAEFDPASGRGLVRQTANPYAIDSVLRVIHTLILAKQGGFLLHAASAVRNGKAFVFSGISGAGKTTISRLAPPDVTLLTDEISYLRPSASGYVAHGTPFAGELAKIGRKVSAPLQRVFLLAKGPENHIEPLPIPDAARLLLRNILFFAADPSEVAMVFQTACDFAARVPVYVLTFYPDAKVWDLIG